MEKIPPNCSFTLDGNVWHAMVNGRIVKATWLSKGAAEAGRETEQHRQQAITDRERGTNRAHSPSLAV
jgi:hypothetical protein